MRWLYRMLLLLHPPRFRRRFSGEMLAIFDEFPDKTSLLADGLASLSRQWVLRSDLWKWSIAAFGGLTICLPALFLAPRPAERLATTPTEAPLAFVLMTAVTAICAVALTLILSVVWFRFAGRRRA